MMYASKLAVAIKVNGKVLREGKSQGSEQDDTVFIPFGSEYTLYVKNMNSVRALVRVSIDGTDATENVSIIVPANGFIELERFVKSGNMNAGLKFKFIERTAKIEDGPRGIKVEDGLIRIEYEFEREPAKIVPPYTITTTWPHTPTPPVVHHHHHHNGIRDSLLRGYSLNSVSADSATYSANAASTDTVNAFNCSVSSAAMDSGDASASSSVAPRTLRSRPISSNSVKMSANTASTKTMGDWSASEMKREAADVNEKGITVGGSKSDQEFHYGAWFPTDGVKHVMIIKILGETGKGKVTKAVTVKTKQECPTCGTKNKHGTKFCRECGTGLEQV